MFMMEDASALAFSRSEASSRSRTVPQHKAGEEALQWLRRRRIGRTCATEKVGSKN